VRQHIWEDVVLFGLQMDPTFLSLFNHGITAGEISAIINALPPIIRAEITRFDISSNQLTQLPPAIGLLTSLTVFSARDNQFTELPAAMSNLTQLHTFNVSHNNFDHTPAVLAHLPALHNLDVSANRLTRISVGVMLLPNLQTIFVNDGVDVPEYINPDITVVRIADDE
jgi:Leucine-rich repeat (LRR) protein